MTKERVTHTMSRTSSHAASHRGRERDHPRADGAPAAPTSSVGSPTSPVAHELRKSPTIAAANVRPSFSFASAAAGKKDGADDADADVEEVAEKIEEVTI